MKHRFARPAALSIAQPVRDVASHVVFDLLPWYHTLDATLQSSEMRPHGWEGVKEPVDDGWMVELCVRFHVGSHVGGGHGTPFMTHEGLGRGAGGE